MMTEDVDVDGEGYLTGQLLIAMPSMSDPRFARTVIYLCAHNAEGAMGLVLNRTITSITFRDLLAELKVEMAGDAPLQSKALNTVREQAKTAAKPKAEDGNACHIGAPMPGSIASVGVTVGQKVNAGDLLLTIEAMKMETGLHADRDAVVKAVHIGPGAQIDAKDLLVEFE